MNESDYISTYAAQLGEELDRKMSIPTHGVFRQVKGNGEPMKASMAVLYDSDGHLIASYPIANMRYNMQMRGPTTIDLELRDYS